MIIDVTGVVLTPGNEGKDCLGNGSFKDNNGNEIECCCDECDFMMCCLPEHSFENCKKCDYVDCPRKE
ncbi:MAG: hypothetical protein IKZ25_02560 [Clostridia bacterium]|nr:hypothetical protein [Clostridia bacterium]